VFFLFTKKIIVNRKELGKLDDAFFIFYLSCFVSGTIMFSLMMLLGGIVVTVLPE